MKKIFLFLLFSLSATTCFAQNVLYGPTISYQSQSGNMVKIGGYYISEFNSKNLFKIDVTANMANFRDQFVAIPEIGFTYYPVGSVYLIPMLEAEFTPYTITPKVGISFLTFFDISLGYGVKIGEKSNLKPIKGFTFSTGFNIPIGKI